MVEKNITRLLNRPLNLGQVESFSFNGLRFGASKVPATPTDPDRVSIEAVDVAFNPLKLILNRTLELEIILLKPDVYIEQDKERVWVSTQLQTLEKGAIDVKLQALRVRDANVVLVPRSQAGKLQQPVAILLPSGASRFFNDNKLIRLDLDGQLVKGGNFRIQGESRPPEKETNLAVSGSDLVATEVGRLLQLPLVLNAGQLDGNLEMQIRPDQPLQFLGTATLENVTARLAVLPKPFAKTNGLLRFKGTKVGLENVTTLFGQIPAQANGVLDTQADINLSARTQPVEVQKVLQAFNFKKLPVVLSGQVQAALQVTGPLSEPIVSGEFVTTKQAQVDRVNFRAISADFKLVGSTLAVNDLRATPTVGGLVTGNGQVKLGQSGNVVFNVQATNVPGDAIAKNYNVKLPVPIGLVTARGQISSSLDNIQNLRATGSTNLKVAGGSVTASNVQVAGQRFQAQVRASAVQVERLAQVPPQLRGLVSGNFNLSGSLTSFSPSTISGSGSGSLNVAGGTVRASDVQIANGRFRTQVQASGVQLERLAQVPPQFRGPVSGNFNLSGSLSSFSPSTISGSGSGSLNVAGSTITASNVELANGRFNAQVRASGVQVERLAQVPPQLRGPLSGNFNLSGSLTSFSPSTISGSGSGSLNVAGGTVTASNVQLANGRFQAVVEPTGVQLAGFSQDLRGRLGGRLDVSGSLAALSPSAIQASGQLNFSEGLALIDRPLAASIVWNGQQLQIQQATASGFSANGVVDVNLANSGLQAIRSFNLNVQAEDLNLQQLPAALPKSVNLAGRADFDGRIAGTPTAPNVNGDLRLRDFVAGGLEFEPLLAGRVSAVPGQGVNLQLRGTQDQINVALGANYQPVSFLVQTQEAIANGTRQGELLLVNAQDFPIDIIKQLAPLPTAIASQPISGRLSGNLAVNLNTYGISGDVAIANPILGSLRGDSFTGTFQYANGVVALGDGEFKQGNNQYLLSGNLTQTPNGPQFQAQLQVAQGELQDVLTALQLFDLSDLSRGFNAPVYGKASNVTVVTAGLPEAPLQTQLRRLSEVEALIRQREELEAASPLPKLAEAKGRFTGTVNVVGSLASGINAEFDIQGEDWKWGSYSANQVIAQGNFQDGILSLLPLRFQSEDSVASFTGNIGGDAQSGQLQLRNISIAQLQAALNLPPAVGFTGLLNATATLSGSLSNPQARGEVTVIDATLNQTPVKSALGSFSYANARLNFGSTILLAETDPLNINGSVPYKLPIASVEPANNQLSLNIDVQNQGLALLNLLSNGQVSWVNGTGNVELKIAGTYDQQANRPSQLVAQGIATVENATLGARVLPEPLTNVTGRVLFDLDRIQVEGVQGQFSGGTVMAAGTIPINQPAPQENPLTVNIGELALNLKGLYRGRVQGDVNVTGTALAPKIGGKVALFNGQVQLPEEGAATAGGEGGGTGGTADSTNPTEFNGLELTLGRDIQITRAPILNFLASGTLTLNGSLDNIRPDGTIQLQRGQVNLFTTQFRLARGYENTAQFVPNRGLDPVLDVRLVAAVAEATGRRLPTDPLSAEISEGLATNFGSVQTVRIQARVEGPASQLADSIELTSTPSRSESEIVALLGGGFVDTLGRGDSTLGLANLAGSALLGNVQNVIGDALGLSEFRLFPTLSTDEKRRTSTLGLAAEAGVDISRNFSVSVLKELTTAAPFEYSLRYRVNNEILLRGATDLSGESRAAVEYERRF
ncbi:MAG TPA: translocation/assembly module TamB domain-containing protein [Leptolyngbyaceae cyanobacterium]